MELSWTTFILEIINFLVLVWILKRFLYQPVLAVIAKRKAAVEKTLSDAKDIEQEANKLKAQYEGRLTEWEQEREQSRENLHQEIESERAKLMDRARTDAEGEREKLRAVDEKKLNDAMVRQQETALAHGGAFASRLLEGVADDHLHGKLIDMALDRLSKLPEESMQSLRSAFNGAQGKAQVTTAFDLPDDRRQALEGRLRELLSADVKFEYNTDGNLKAGLRVIVGPWVLHANLADELKAFTESAHERD